MTWNAMRQLQEGCKPLRLGRAVLFDIFPPLSPPDDRTHCNDKHIPQEMTAIGGIGTTGIGQRGTMRIQRCGRMPTHEECSSGAKASDDRQPHHCHGKLSRFSNALTLESLPGVEQILTSGGFR